MKEAYIRKGPKVEIVDSPIPKPNADQLVIEVLVSGSNPKDWKMPEWMDSNINQGDDIAGIVHEVGDNVTEFKVGDRVAAFHEMMSPHGSYAEYALAWQHTTFHIPKKTSFEEAAAIPLAAMTSAIGLFSALKLPQPFGSPATEPTPLIIYGAASAVGAYAVQLAVRANIHPLLCVAGKSIAHVESLIDRSKGDTIIDYRGGADQVVAGLKKAYDGKILHALDAVSDYGSFLQIGEVLAPGGAITVVLAGKDFGAAGDHVTIVPTRVGSVHKDEKDFGYVYFRYFARGLAEGWFKPQPQEVVPGGLGGVEKALANLKEGKANAIKYVFRIAETEGLS
ncbi:GroES-like protein [Xylariaceae sp. FL0255]|nr:GroES-like protein [Xylariaceae sp. FL0255]